MGIMFFKCKACGGNIQLTGKTHGVCDSCGNECTFPVTQDEKRINMFNRGTYFRQKGDYDEAYSAFEHIIAEDNTDAEAHWNLVLCRYGVEYVEDSGSKRYLPTLHRNALDSILDDLDYKFSVEEAEDAQTREIYKRSAQEIYQIQERYWDISRREEPYDVFICFKDRDDNTGKYTESSAQGLKIHDRLKEEGFKVFFSRVTLKERGGEEYEPIIFAALNSAKVMLLLANRKEQLEARWVKNEWSRYLKLCAKDKSKTLLPVYFDITREDFPKQIRNVLQAIDMSDVGAMENLVHAVKKLTGRLNSSQSQPSAVPTVSNMMKRVKQALGDEEYEEAERLLDQALNVEPENGEAYFLQLMAQCRVNNEEMLMHTRGYVEKRTTFLRAFEYGDEQQRERLYQIGQENETYNQYLEAVDDFQSGNVEAALNKFESLGDYGDSATYCKKCRQAHEYQMEVGDGKTYITEKIKKDKPSEYQTFMTMQEHVTKQLQGFQKYGESGKNFRISGTLLLVSALLLFFPLPAAQNWGEFIGICTLAIFLPVQFVRGFIKKIAGGLGLFLLLAIFAEIISGFGWFFLIVGAAILARGVFYLQNGGRYEDSLQKAKDYDNSTIQPLENEICEEINKKYDMLDDKFRVSLKGIPRVF